MLISLFELNLCLTMINVLIHGVKRKKIKKVIPLNAFETWLFRLAIGQIGDVTLAKGRC